MTAAAGISSVNSSVMVSPRSADRSALRVPTVLGLGGYAPSRVVTNASIADRIGVDDAWIVKRTGIRSRRWIGPDQRVSDLAVLAAREALREARVDAADLDLVLVATMSQDEVTPNTAPLVAHALGAGRAGSMDIGAACVGWIAALGVGSGQIESGRAERVLVIGADALSRLTDPDDRSTAALFGDGAAAVVLGAGGPNAFGRVGPISLSTKGALADLIVASHADRLIRMDGPATFRHAVTALAEISLACLSRAGLGLEDIDHFVLHQANGRILRAVRDRLNLPAGKVADYIESLGNTAAASIPLALTRLARDGHLRPGQRVLMAATGAGFVCGAGILEWEGEGTH